MKNFTLIIILLTGINCAWAAEDTDWKNLSAEQQQLL